MKLLQSAFVLSAAIFSVSSFADVSVGDHYSSGSCTISVTQIQSCVMPGGDFRFVNPRLSCSEKSEIEGFLKVTEITTSIVTVAAACTPVGAPVVVGAGIIGVANQMISLVVSNLDCEDKANEEKIDRLVKTSVCEAMIRQGLQCDPADFSGE